jgi:hypothetical protein
LVVYMVGEGEEHRVDHAPVFACREHKNLLRLSQRFVEELLEAAQDIMPGNPEEIATAFLREAGPTFRLPEFLMPPKLVLFNPRGLRGAEALPFATVLVDKKFFGIPARYFSPDRFEGCEECDAERADRRPSPAQGTRPAPPPPGPPRGAPPAQRSGTDSAIRRPGPPLDGSGAQRRPGGAPPPAGGSGPRPQAKPGGPPKPGPR